MIHIDLLQYKNQLNTRTENGITRIFDPVRKQWIVLQPEELVRQLFIHYCISTKLGSVNNISVERQIRINNLERRYDIALHNSEGLPWLLIECKAPSIPVTQKTMNQIAHYNMVLKVPYLIVTNGVDTFGCQIDFDKNTFVEISEIPGLKEIRDL